MSAEVDATAHASMIGQDATADGNYTGGNSVIHSKHCVGSEISFRLTGVASFLR
jgi:hypothetical protein